jgi:urease accessory protein
MPNSATTLLRLMGLASPALPVGGFSYSEGLEPAVEGGVVGNETQATEWLLNQLHTGLARAELPAVAQAFDAWQRAAIDGAHGADAVTAVDDIEAINTWVRNTRETAELRQQTEQTGRSLAEWLRNSADAADPRVAWLAATKPAPTWPVAFALAAAFTGANKSEALLAYAFGWAENMCQAAMKAVPLGQLAAQRVLARLVLVIPDVVAAAKTMPADQQQAFTPMLAILSAQHETQYSRLFRS